MMLLISTTAYSNSDDWLWEKEAKPLETNGSKTVVVCVPGEECKLLIIYNN